MATEVKRDLLSGTQGTQDVNGWNFTIIYYVTGVQGTTGVEKIANAIIAPGIPDFGTDLSLVDPTFAGCWLRSKTAVPDTGDKFKVTLIYKQDRLTNIESIAAGASINTVDTNIDISGNTMEVSYTYPDPYPLSPDLAGETVVQGGLVQKFLPEATLTFIVREPISPMFFRNFYENKVNEFVWFDGQPGEWLCTSITGFSDDGVNYKNTYSFQLRQNLLYDTPTYPELVSRTGWQATVLFKDTKTGNPPSDLVDGVGEKRYVIYDKADFFDLFSDT